MFIKRLRPFIPACISFGPFVLAFARLAPGWKGYLLSLLGASMLGLGLASMFQWMTEIRTDRETRCRKCGYILKGITEPRCPECGERI